MYFPVLPVITPADTAPRLPQTAFVQGALLLGKPNAAVGWSPDESLSTVIVNVVAADPASSVAGEGDTWTEVISVDVVGLLHAEMPAMIPIKAKKSANEH